jgi:ATP-dependent Zn protease
VILIAATNHPEQIDPAILRAGRLDRSIHVDLPDTQALRDIFRFYLADGLDGVELTPLAIAARGKSGADVKAYVTRAKAHARRAKRALELKDVLSEIREGRIEMSAEMRKLISVHEAGHAVASLHYGLGNLESVEIGDYGGSTVHKVDLDTMQDQSSLADYLVVLMAGAAAEEVLIGQSCLGSSVGPENDLVKATQIATQLELAWQVGKPAPMTLALPHEAILLALPELRDQVQTRLTQASESARKLITTKRMQVEQVANKLAQCHYLSGEEVAKLYIGNHSEISIKQVEHA